MLNDNDKINIKVLMYKDINTTALPIQTNYIESDKDNLFKLPEQTKKIKIIEYDYGYSSPRIKKISTIYLGIELSLKEILKYGKKIIIDTDLGFNINEPEKELYIKRLLISYTKDGAIIIKKVLNDNEIVMDSLYDIEYYLKVLSEEITTINNEITNAKKLIKLGNFNK